MIRRRGPYEADTDREGRERESAHIPSLLTLRLRPWEWTAASASSIILAENYKWSPMITNELMRSCDAKTVSTWQNDKECRAVTRLPKSPSHRPGLDMSLTACIVRSPEACKKIAAQPVIFVACNTWIHPLYVIHTLSTNLRSASFISLPPCVPSGLAQGIYSWQCTWQWLIQAIPYRSDMAIPLKQSGHCKR